jgi:hypothetical protein
MNFWLAMESPSNITTKQKILWVIRKKFSSQIHETDVYVTYLPIYGSTTLLLGLRRFSVS